jgi:HAD superfamily hydrolase (TIGR01509 family)
VEYYDVLANTVGGGKPKMRYHFDNNGWPAFFGGSQVPASEEQKSKMVDALQDQKTEFYKEIVESTATARPGVLRLIDEAIAAPDIAVGICSAATKEGFLKVVNSIVGPERLSRLDVIMAGDDVTRKKPDPLIYNLAREKVNLPSSKCVVIEDSLVGLRAAMGADMPCVITPCPSSDVPDFKAHGAKAVMDVNVGLGDGANEIVTLAKLFPPGAEAPNFDFGGGYGSSGAGSYSSSGGGQPSYGAAAPVTRVTRGADGVVYDPDQFDADANRRSR